MNNYKHEMFGSFTVTHEEKCCCYIMPAELPHAVDTRFVSKQKLHTHLCISNLLCLCGQTSHKFTNKALRAPPKRVQEDKTPDWSRVVSCLG